MSFMTDQFKADWGLANNTDTAIITFQIPLSTGVKILDSLLPKIEMDIKILDEKKYSEIKNKIEESSKEFNSEAEKIKVAQLNNLKHTKQQEILVSIQNMGYRSGWLD
jgi:hypothetical protein